MYYLIYSLFWFITLAPLWLLYLLSDIFFYIVYYVARYRRKVVRRNLVGSFPNKSLAEIIVIEKKFYKHFSDIFFETVCQVHFSEKQIQKRMTFKNTEIITEQYAKNKSVMLMTAHYGNWEWTSGLGLHLPADKTFYGVYKKLSNKHFDRLMKSVRTRFGGGSIEAQDVFKTMLKMKNSGTLGAFTMVADQRPAAYSTRHWMTFLNQDTSVMIGTEQLAKKFDYPLILMNVTRRKRGYYTCEFEMIEENPKQTENYEVTEKFMQMLEEKINQYPEYWLWTHNRWRHKRPVEKIQQ